MNLTTPTKEAAMIEILNLIELTPETRGDVPSDVMWLVEVPVLIGQPMPDYFLVWDNVRWLRRSASGGFFKPGHFEHRFARPATQSEIEAFRGRITDGTVTDPSNRGRESGVSSETLPDETAPPALARVESDLTAQSGGSIRPNKRLNWGEEMANAWQRGEFGNEPLLPAAKPLTFGRYMVEGGKAYELLSRDAEIMGTDLCRPRDGSQGWCRITGKHKSLAATQMPAFEYRRPLPSTAATYALLQAAWCEHFGVRVGTRVRVVRKAHEELGWEDGWIEDMDDMIGGTFPITGIAPNGISVNNEWSFPFHVLEPLPAASEGPTDSPAMGEERDLVPPVPGFMCEKCNHGHAGTDHTGEAIDCHYCGGTGRIEQRDFYTLKDRSEEQGGDLWAADQEKQEHTATIARLTEENTRMRGALEAVLALINESRGVAGLHANGDVATWESLRTGGRFEEWLMSFDAALAEGVQRE